MAPPTRSLIQALVAVFIASCSGGGPSSTPSSTPVAITQFKMEGASMEPTLHNGDVLNVQPYQRPVGHNDLIVFYAPTSPNRMFLKRVIGEPGYEIVIVNATGELMVNGLTWLEPYVQGKTTCDADCTFSVPAINGPAPVPEREPPPRAHLQGSAEIAACKQTACYFVLGDNRQNSSDSRQGWLVPVDNIIGYVVQP